MSDLEKALAKAVMSSIIEDQEEEAAARPPFFRSTKLARYVQAAMRKKGARAIYNLKGGIFAWHNENKSLANARGQTSFVHPYNKYWGQLVDKQSLTRYK